MAGTTSEVEVFPDLDALARRAIEIFDGEISYAMSERGRVSIALSRPTPKEVFEQLDSVRLPRAHTDFFQVDERHAKAGTDDRNLTLMKNYLPSWCRDARMHPMPVDAFTLTSGARRYARDLESVGGRPPVIDLVHLGLGPDGHCASLLPGTPVLDVDDRSVAAVRRRTTREMSRMTLTYPTIDAARLVVFIVTGEEKAEALGRVLEGDRTMPAARIANPNVVFLADREAAARIA